MKTLIQWFLFIIIITTLSIIFFKYFHINSTDPDTVSQKKEEFKLDNKVSNLISNLSYKKTDIQGNIFFIKAREGKIIDNNKDEILMNDVEAFIELTDNGIINIQSKNSNFNNQNFNSIFYNGVKMKYLDHTLSGEKLEFLFNENLIIFQNNINYISNSNFMLADKIIIDIVTKETKIFSKDQNNKIKITNN